MAQQRVYNNVEGHRLLDNNRVTEDITSISVPTIEHPTSTISGSGMAADVEMPNKTHVNAMEFSVNHNNGLYCERLADPGKHNIEVRVVRQRYNVANGDLGHESVKFRLVGLHKKSEKGTIENGNPLGGTDTFSLLRYEEEVNGKVVKLVDAMTGVIKINGVDCTSEVENMLK